MNTQKSFKNKIHMRFLIILVFISLTSHAMAKSKNIADLKLEKLKLELRYAVAGPSKWSEMVEIADEILKLEPKNPDACFEKAQGLAWLGKHKDAIIFYDLAVKYKYRYLGALYYRRGICLESLGRDEDALKSYDLAIKYGYDDRGVYFNRDGVLLRLGRLGKNSD